MYDNGMSSRAASPRCMPANPRPGPQTTTSLSFKDIFMYDIGVSPARVRSEDRAPKLRCVPRDPNYLGA
jgi:hypothetical protein